MHDLNYFRDHLEVFAEMVKKRGAVLDLDAFRKLDKERRELITRDRAAQSTAQQGQRRNRPAQEGKEERRLHHRRNEASL